MAKIGRNNACPCGSGKKHKKCCLEVEGAPPVRALEPIASTTPVCHSCGRHADGGHDDVVIDEINDRADHILDELLGGRVDAAEMLCHDFLRDFPDQAEGLDLLSMIYEGPVSVKAVVAFVDVLRLGSARERGVDGLLVAFRV